MSSARRIGRYELVRRVGKGGMGEVYLATLEPVPGVKKLAALKLLREVGLEAGDERGFAAEARLGASITHPNVVQLLDAGVEDEVPWIAMEFVAGLSLHELLAVARNAGSGLPPWVSARIIADACAGVHAVHEAKNERGEPLGIVHRDVTPHNVLVSWDGSVKITDFGVARSTLQATVTQTGTVKGKLSYMAPEQAAGSRVDRRVDVFALGVLLWEALAGQKLFKGGSPTETLARVLRCEVPPLSEAAPSAPAELGPIVARALKSDPAARFSTARDLGRAIESAMRGAGVDVGPSEVADVIESLVPERVREHEAWLREHEAESVTVVTAAPVRRPSRLPLALSLGALASIAAGAAIWLSNRPEPPPPLALGAAPLGERVAAIRIAAAPAPPPSATPAAPAASAAPAPAAVVKREQGTLHVGSTPVWSSVTVDGRSVGATPIAGLRIEAGTHVVEARAQGKPPGQRRVVRVPANGSARVHFDFAR